MTNYSYVNNNNGNLESDSDNEAMKENYIELAKGFNDLMEKMKEKTKTNASKISKGELEQMEDYYERQIQMRAMHIQTLTVDNNELKDVNKIMIQEEVLNEINEVLKVMNDNIDKEEVLDQRIDDVVDEQLEEKLEDKLEEEHIEQLEVSN